MAETEIQGSTGAPTHESQLLERRYVIRNDLPDNDWQRSKFTFSLLFLFLEIDRWEIRESVKLSREIFGQDAFIPYRGPELAPGSSCQTDAQIDEFVRRMGDSAYHPSCTCKMGSAKDDDTVVDEETRVVGQ